MKKAVSFAVTLCAFVLLAFLPANGRQEQSSPSNADDQAKGKKMVYVLCLPKEQILRLHDGSQDTRSVRLRNRRRTAVESSAKG